MNHLNIKPFSKIGMAKVALGGAALVALGAGKMLWDLRPRKMVVVKDLDLNRFQGTWYEIVRKPAPYERQSYKNIAFVYQIKSELDIRIELHYQTKEGRITQIISEGQVTNPPENSKFSIHFLPAIRGVQRRRRWVMRINDDYSVALVGSPSRKHFWLLSKTPTPDKKVIDDFLDYAKAQGFSLKDIIFVTHDQ